MPVTNDPRYDERLGVPLRWWVQGTMLVASLWLALVVAVPGPLAWAVSGCALALLAALLLVYGSARIEVRSLDSGANPYLAYALLLAAGLKGIEEGYELPPGAEDDVWSLTSAERRAMGYEALPENLAEAIDVMAGSELVAEVLGEHVFDFFLRNKRAEWEQYRREVTPYERERYLGAL